MEYFIDCRVSAEEIKNTRKSLNLTQEQFANLVGVSKPTVLRWEKSKEPIIGPISALIPFLTPEYAKHNEIPERTKPLRLWYMYKSRPCTLIDVDDNRQEVEIRNYTANLQFRAFGGNENPSYEDYREFLKSRCFAESRDKMKLILEDLDIPFYDPFLIIQKTKGKMAEDDFWIRIEENE